MRSECVRCPKLGKECRPSFVSMSPQELIAWCKERKKFLGLTNGKLADMSGMSQGTIDSLLANTHPDFKFGTIRPLLQALIGGDWADVTCPDPDGSSKQDAGLQEEIRTLKSDIGHRDMTIQHYEDQIASMKTLVANTNARYTKQIEELQATIKDLNERHAHSQDFLRDQLRGRNKTVTVLSVLLGLALTVIIAALIIDRIDPSKGFFWIDVASWFEHGGMMKMNV